MITWEQTVDLLVGERENGRRGTVRTVKKWALFRQDGWLYDERRVYDTQAEALAWASAVASANSRERLEGLGIADLVAAPAAVYENGYVLTRYRG